MSRFSKKKEGQNLPKYRTPSSFQKKSNFGKNIKRVGFKVQHKG